jgi:hypothetical protein
VRDSPIPGAQVGLPGELSQIFGVQAELLEDQIDSREMFLRRVSQNRDRHSRGHSEAGGFISCATSGNVACTWPIADDDWRTVAIGERSFS